MKNLLLINLIIIFISCETKKEEKKQMVNYPFTASYSSDVSMGDPNLSNIVLELQKAANEGDFEKTMSFLHEDFQGTLSDGSTANKEDVMAIYKPVFETTKLKINPHPHTFNEEDSYSIVTYTGNHYYNKKKNH